jgi:hypothetical protein
MQAVRERKTGGKTKYHANRNQYENSRGLSSVSFRSNMCSSLTQVIPMRVGVGLLVMLLH